MGKKTPKFSLTIKSQKIKINTILQFKTVAPLSIFSKKKKKKYLKQGLVIVLSYTYTISTLKRQMKLSEDHQ